MNAQVVVLFPDRDRLAVEAAEPGDTILNEGELAAAMWAWRNNQPAGRGADMLHGAKWLHMPLRSTTQTIGVLALCFDSPEAVALPEQRRLLDALIDQAIVAIERARLAHDIEQAKLLSERERLQAIFLSSVSHDLRTPLASIIGAASSLLDGSEAYDERTRRDLLATIQEEAERLNRFVGNLLDTTRLESGSLKLNREWVEINDVIGAALAQLSSRLAGRGVNVVVEPGLPMLRLDFVLMQQVFINLFENAAKYSGEGEPIRIAARRDGEAIRIDVEDRGVGIPASDIELIFDKFYRVQRGDRQIAGTGLGLSICRGIVEEHDGKIVAESPIAEGKGTRFSVLFPIEKESPVLEGTEAAD
jgi:two-component system sensor histidine kinase KdpD